MFEKGENIVYGTTGVCEVTDIRKMNMRGIPKDKLFYVLTPRYPKGSTVFIPVDSTKTLMRKVLSKEQAQEILDSIEQIEEVHVSNEKMREEKYKECIRSCDCREYIRVIKTLRLRREEKLAQGKKFPVTDERYLKMAEDNLYAELAVALDVSRQEAGQLVEESLSFT